MKNKENLLLGLLAGAAIGIAVGMLYSPRKGTALRKAIRRKGEGMVDDVAETIEERIAQLSDAFTEKIEMLKGELKSRINSATDFSME
jgi:gas vesicle protein